MLYVFFWVRLHCKAVDSQCSIELQCFVVKFQSPALLFESINYCNIEIFMGNHSNGHDVSGGGFVERSPTFPPLPPSRTEAPSHN